MYKVEHAALRVGREAHRVLLGYLPPWMVLWQLWHTNKPAQQSEESQIKTLSCRYCAEVRIHLAMSPTSVFPCTSYSSKNILCIWGTRGSKQQSGAGRGLLRWEALPPTGRGVRLCMDTCVCTVAKRQRQEGVLLETWACFPSAHVGHL